MIINVIEVGQDSVHTLHSKLRSCAERTAGKTQEGKVTEGLKKYLKSLTLCLNIEAEHAGL